MAHLHFSRYGVEGASGRADGTSRFSIASAASPDLLNGSSHNAAPHDRRVHLAARYSSQVCLTEDDHNAAQIVAEYLPHRPRPKSNEGLKKNLRRSSDGRWRWQFLDGPRAANANRRQLEGALQEAARRIEIPVLLIRGASSELVKESHVQEFLKLVPHAEYVNVGGIWWRVIATITSPLPSYLSLDDCRRRPRQAPA